MRWQQWPTSWGGGQPVAFLPNPFYRHGNALSQAAAEAWAGDDPFLLAMGDHILEPEMARRLAAGWQGGLVACVDSSPCSRQMNDATRVMRDATGRLQAIGKGLREWNAVDVGLFVLDGRVFAAIERLRQERGPDLELGEVLASLVCDGVPFATCDVAGLHWADVDTPEDYEAAVRALLAVLTNGVVALYLLAAYRRWRAALPAQGPAHHLSGADGDASPVGGDETVASGPWPRQGGA